MTVDKLRTHYGLTRTPFSRGIAPSQLAFRTSRTAFGGIYVAGL